MSDTFKAMISTIRETTQAMRSTSMMMDDLSHKFPHPSEAGMHAREMYKMSLLVEVWLDEIEQEAAE